MSTSDDGNKTAREALGKFLYDLAKLTFAAIVLGEMIILHDDWRNLLDWVMIAFGCLLTLSFAYLGKKLFKEVESSGKCKLRDKIEEDLDWW